MRSTARRLLEATLKLPDDDKLEFVEELVSALDGPEDEDVEAAWAKEVQRRSREIVGGKVLGVSWAATKRVGREKLRGNA